MCTVTYLPKNKTNFILTSSRDEQVMRQSHVPEGYFIENKSIFFPKDPKSGGTWIACSEGRLVCLLNGAFKKHVSSPPYRKSRGLVVLDYFSFSGIEEFCTTYSFENIEPFTLVVIEDVLLYEFRWDGITTHLISLDRERPHIWSSCTLYSPEVIQKREQWFSNWLSSQNTYLAYAIRDFHNSGGEGDIENDFNMVRQYGLQTISISTVEKSKNHYYFTHQDMVSKNYLHKEICLV